MCGYNMIQMNVMLLLVIILTVGTNGVVGTIEESQEECSSCLKGNCQTISGLYTRQDLPIGYNLVATIPQGSCKILLQQLKQTRNFIAIRNTNGTYIINGHWKFSNSQVKEGAGTRFVYRKQDSTAVETITGIGPLLNPVDIMIVNQESNPGIKYQYSLPLGTQLDGIPPTIPKLSQHNHHHHHSTTKINNNPKVESKKIDLNQKDEPVRGNVHRKRKRFAWKISGTTPCSKSCDGGIQTTIITCVREHNQTPVLDKRCLNLERPAPQLIKCNQNECPDTSITNSGRWDGVWGPCTGSCGQGIQQFISQCSLDRGGRAIVVSDTFCTKPKPSPLTSPCKLTPCSEQNDNEIHTIEDWVTGAWSHCSVTCGIGVRTRSVTCSNANNCHFDTRPLSVERCENTPCLTEKSLDSFWLVTEWSQCSVLCGTGEQTRQAICPIDTRCDENSKPEITRSCSTDKQCNGYWYVGPWSKCTDPCHGQSKQTRDVICIVQVRGQSRITNDNTCSLNERPDVERICEEILRCSDRWFVGEWTECDCQGGTIQKRDVRCLTSNGQNTNGCKVEDMPLYKKSCACHENEKSEVIEKPVKDERIPDNRECQDRIRNCYMAVQARLCQYQYYQAQCCISCAKALHDLTII